MAATPHKAFKLRLPLEMHKDLEDIAAAEGVSIHSLILQATQALTDKRARKARQTLAERYRGALED